MIPKEIPAKKLKRKHVYRGYAYDVVADQVRWPNGKVLKRDLIVHPGISVILPLDGKKIILIRQYRYGAGKYLWEIPAGTMRKGEPPINCARRELQEEIGYKAKKWTKLCEVNISPGLSTEKIYCFLAEKLVSVDSALEDDEILYPKAFTPGQVYRMIRSGQIIDAKTLLALFYFFEKHGQ
jgi:ADP-ribose pyrophosphatase